MSNFSLLFSYTSISKSVKLLLKYRKTISTRKNKHFKINKNYYTQKSNERYYNYNVQIIIFQENYLHNDFLFAENSSIQKKFNNKKC